MSYHASDLGASLDTWSRVSAVSRRDEELRGALQLEVMRTVWRLEEATVDDVRAAQPLSRRAAYTTIQTVMNRLLDRGLLDRKRRGKAFVYRARYPESEYVARSMRERLAGASANARRPALLSLVEGLEQDELEELARYANRVRRERKER
ncbi:MAG TPA: BlaI/MecI/CopY family transcriptional regulator [Thermoleophilaceae bacterium]|nr:BlaI/MecI/CopY family transcriptional regulator [Thermoleophilaceae bacterium]